MLTAEQAEDIALKHAAASSVSLHISYKNIFGELSTATKGMICVQPQNLQLILLKL